MALVLASRGGSKPMNNTQLYLAIGVPFFSLLVVFFMNNRSIEAMLTEMREGFGRIDSRLDRMDARFDRMDSRFDSLERDLREFYGTQRQHYTRLNAIERKQA